MPVQDDQAADLVRNSRVQRRPGRLFASGPWLWAVVAVLATVAARLAYLLSARVEFNGDEAATGVMVRGILAGHQAGFFAGQHYGGTIEQYVQAVGYAVLRLPQNEFTLRLTQVVFCAITCWLVFLCGRMMLPSPGHAAVAAMLFAVAPWFNVMLGATSLGFYAAAQTLGMLTLYLALRFDCLPSSVTAFGLGLAAGLALWTAIISLYVLVPVSLWLLPAARRMSRRCRLLIAAGAVIGAAPLVQLMLWQHKLPLPDATAEHIPLWQRVGRLVGPILRESLGVSYSYDRGGLPRRLAYLAQALALVVLAVAMWRRRYGLAALLRGHADRRQPIDVLLLTALVVAVLYVSSPSARFIDNPRYVFTVFPLLCLGAAAVLPRARGKMALTAAVLIGAATGSTVGFFTTTSIRPSTAFQRATFERAIAILQTRGETAIYADYWTAMPVQYYSDSRVAAAAATGAQRFPATERAVADRAEVTYLLTTLDDSARKLETALNARQITYRVTSIGFLRLYDHLSTSARPRDLNLWQRPYSH